MKSSINEEAKINQSMELVERFYKIVKEKLSDKETLKRILGDKETLRRMSKSFAIGVTREIPVIGQLLGEVIKEFFPSEKEKLLKELKELSEDKLNEISKKVGISVDLLEKIRELTLYKFEKLEKNTEEIKEVTLQVLEKLKHVEGLKKSIEEIKELLLLELKKHEELPTIEDVLRKGEIEKEDFFRKEPMWIDFEKGCIVERKEVDEIIEKLENNDKIHLVLGEPASGKSVILKNIGFKLAKQGKKVYFIDLKRHSDEEVKELFERIPELNAVSIIDDAHLKLFGCEKLVKEFKRRGKGSLLIGSREVDELRKWPPIYSSEFEYLNKTKIEAKDATEDIIRLFLKRKHNLEDRRIEIISKNLERYKHDLWLLSWALLAYNPEKDSVEKEEIVEKVKDSIREIKKNGKVNAEEVFYPLSVFYRFEIPVERRFIENLGIDERTIDELLSLGELIEFEEIGKRKMLLLHHSSIADIYFEAYKSYPDLGGKLRNWDELSLFYKYLGEAENSLDVIIGLGRDWLDKKGGKTTLRKLVESEDFVGLIRGAINEERDLWKIVSCLSGIAEASERVASKIAEKIDVKLLSSKINEERDLEKIGSCLYSIARVSEEVALKLVDPVASRINEERDLEKIGRCLSGIAWIWISERVALKLVDPVASKINEERDLRKIRWCLSEIAEASKRVASKIAEGIDVKLLSSKIKEERDLEKIGSCLSGIARASEEVALKLVDPVASKINEERDLEKIGLCLSEIAEANEKVALKLVDLVASKINEGRDLGKIGWCLYWIVKAGGEVEREILKRLRPELREILRIMMELRYLNSE